MEIIRNFTHRTFGAVGTATLSADVSGATLDGKPLPDASVEYLLNFALQSLQDAYAGAKTEAEAKAMWAKKRDALIAGTIGVRGTGAGVSEETKVQRMVARTALKAALGAKSPKWEAFTGKPETEQAEILDKVFADNAAKLGVAVKTELARRAEARKGIAIEVDVAL